MLFFYFPLYSSYLSLGEVSSPLTMENDHLVIKYTDGDTCPGTDQTRKRSTEISIECDRARVVRTKTSSCM